MTKHIKQGFGLGVGCFVVFFFFPYSRTDTDHSHVFVFLPYFQMQSHNNSLEKKVLEAIWS